VADIGPVKTLDAVLRILPSQVHDLPAFDMDSAVIHSVVWIAAGLVESTAVHGTQCSLGLDVTYGHGDN
jgi:hypothetical protein